MIRSAAITSLRQLRIGCRHRKRLIRRELPIQSVRIREFIEVGKEGFAQVVDRADDSLIVRFVHDGFRRFFHVKSTIQRSSVTRIEIITSHVRNSQTT